jgi:hypothetical protein
MRRKITYDPDRDYYIILGIQDDASLDEIRQSYRHRVREVHPDLHPEQADWATDQIQLINEAYSVLRNPRQRKEYDKQRWPHAAHYPRSQRSTYHSPFSGSRYDPNVPWWDQIPQRPARHPFAADPPSHLHTATAAGQPLWQVVSDWLRDHRLDTLDQLWMHLVRLWHSPHAGLLSVLAILLALNVSLIIYFLFVPESDSGFLRNLFGDGLSDASQSSDERATQPVLTVTPESLVQWTCDDPHAQISRPAKYEAVGDTLAVYGTAAHPEMWNYRVEIGYLGQSIAPNMAPSGWTRVRAAPSNQSIREPAVDDDLLADGVDLSGEPAGYYVIRLRVTLIDGSELDPCDVIVRH